MFRVGVNVQSWDISTAMEDCITIFAILPMLISVCMWKNGTYFLISCCRSIKAHFLKELLKDSNHTILDKFILSFSS